eukprot:561479-Rhodomonas_salina.2
MKPGFLPYAGSATALQNTSEHHTGHGRHHDFGSVDMHPAQAVEIKSSNYGAAANTAGEVRAKKVESLGSLLKKPTTASGNAQAGKRIMKELSEMAKGESGAGCHLFPDTDNMHLMKALIEGPAGTPFEGGAFVLDVTVSQQHPFKPPHVKFETPIFHCNVTEGGGICLDVLHDRWSPSLTIPKVLETIRDLMLNPNIDDALRQWIAELTIAHRRHGDEDRRYIEQAKALTAQHASKSVSDWKSAWGLEA